MLDLSTTVVVIFNCYFMDVTYYYGINKEAGIL